MNRRAREYDGPPSHGMTAIESPLAGEHPCDLVERGREIRQVLEDVDREHAVEEPVVEGKALLAVSDEGRDAVIARFDVVRELLEELDRVVLLGLQVLVAEVRAEPGADLQRAPPARRASRG